MKSLFALSYGINQLANAQVALSRWCIALLGATMTVIILLQVFSASLSTCHSPGARSWPAT